MQKIILASQSPRRKQLLEWAEVPFETVIKHAEETFPPHLSTEEVPVHIAREKAMAVRHYFIEQGNEQVSWPLLAADTVVVLGKQIIGKPRDRDDALEILTALSGKTHQVITGVVVLHGDTEIAFADVTEVIFHSLTRAQLEFYVDKYQPYDKAGAYAIQEWIGVVGIQSVRGDFYNVMGLPVSRVVQALQQLSTP